MRNAPTSLTWIVVALPCWALAPVSLYSQDAEGASAVSPVAKGTRVRVTASFVRSERTVGEVDGIADGALRISADGDLVTVPVENIEILETSLGRRANAGRGAILGTVIGGLAGLAVGLVDGGSECSSDAIFCTYETSAGQAAAMGLLTGAAVGAGVGAIVGALVKTEKWETVPVSALSLGPAHGGGWRVAVAFALP